MLPFITTSSHATTPTGPHSHRSPKVEYPLQGVVVSKISGAIAERATPIAERASRSADRDRALLYAPVVGLVAGQPDVDDAALDPQADVGRIAPAVAGDLEPGTERDEPRVHRALAETGGVPAGRLPGVVVRGDLVAQPGTGGQPERRYLSTVGQLGRHRERPRRPLP